MHCFNFYTFKVLWSILKFYHTFLLLLSLFRKKTLYMSTNFFDNFRNYMYIVIDVLYGKSFEISCSKMWAFVFFSVLHDNQNLDCEK